MPAGYRVDVASRGQAQCNGQKPCKGTKIAKGEFRIGVWVEFQGHGSFKWRHWGCTTEKVLSNLKEQFDEASEVDGYEELPPVYQAKFDKAWKVGHVDDEDIPETARKPSDHEDGDEPASSPVKKKASKKKKGGDDDDEDKKPKKAQAKSKGVKKESADGEDTKPKVKPAPKKKPAKKVKKESSEELSESEEESEESEMSEEESLSEEDVKPKKAKRKSKGAISDEDDVKPSTKKPRPSKSKAAPPARPQRASKTRKNLAESNSDDSDSD
ncbi:hypothetical protein JCM24511_01025 [Saitozyma sp. JCM 24511]|nr:hypothetical protein JCM24511_01025 [Saitozyma sp. JCM 24511]